MDKEKAYKIENQYLVGLFLRRERDSLIFIRASLRGEAVQAIKETSQMFIPNFISIPIGGERDSLIFIRASQCSAGLLANKLKIYTIV